MSRVDLSPAVTREFSGLIDDCFLYLCLKSVFKMLLHRAAVFICISHGSMK